MERHEHWERVYATKSPLEVSWYEPHLEDSLAWIRGAAPEKSAAILDVGGGASTLVDDLWAEGYRALSVLDISQRALAHAQERLGERASKIRWIAGDITRVELPEAAFDVWHDRAVLHFLTAAEDRALYRRQLARALKPGGRVILAAFSKQGPEKCSGLTVCRYDARLMEQEFGPDFRLMKSAAVQHATPGGGRQEFLYCRLERVIP